MANFFTYPFLMLLFGKAAYWQVDRV